MRRIVRSWRIWGVVLAVAAVVAAVLISLMVWGAQKDGALTATAYSDVVRFEVEASAAELQIRIYDLSSHLLWDSGAEAGRVVDWDRTTEGGERLAYGAYLYRAVARGIGGTTLLDTTGKLWLLPGDEVRLTPAPERAAPVGLEPAPAPSQDPPASPKSFSAANWYVSGRLGVGTDTPTYDVDVSRNLDGGARMCIQNPNTGATGFADLIVTTGAGNGFAVQKFGSGFSAITWSGMSVANWARFRSDSTVAGLIFTTGGASPLVFGTSDVERMRVAPSGNVGIGTSNPTDKLTIEGATGNLIACYPNAARTAGSAVFRVENDGDTYADGSVYASEFVIAGGGADVAERINVSEWVDAGCVVEIDPEHPGFFRKTTSPYSTRVAGIISTSPGVVLGNSPGGTRNKWDDARPVLAIAGRVPVKVTTENGPIAVGDLLVSSSVPGVAMKGDPAVSVGRVVGKAMEPLREGVATITAQVMLR